MTLQKLLRQRQLKRRSHDCIQHAKHILHMREDLLSESQRETATTAIRVLQQLVRERQWDAVGAGCERLMQVTSTLKGGRAQNSLVENLEMLIVAITVAMGLRAYFLQPFKIPTGSMQPTLNGITAVTTEPEWSDRLPMKLARFVLAGEWYSEVRATASGRLGDPMEHPRDSSVLLFRIGGQIHRIPRDVLNIDAEGHLKPPFHSTRVVQQGDVLWAGRTQRGDHLFVNKVIWNFRRPQRDEVMVFTTDNIPSLEPGTHYIKRMVGLPGESIVIQSPYLVINDQRVAEYFGIDRVTSAENGYAGWTLPEQLRNHLVRWRTNESQYFALGDNTQNSRDSRYWGPVPQENLVGPAVFVYWPLTRRWGLIR